MRRHPETIEFPGALRYLAPPAAVSGVVVGTAAGLVSAAGGPAWLRAGWLAPAGYAALVLAGSAANARGLPRRSARWLPVVYATMHGAWGVGFLTSPEDLRA